MRSNDHGGVLPPALQTAIDHASVILHESVACDLSVQDRLPIYDFFNALPPRDQRRAATFIASRTARKVLDRWEISPSPASPPAMPQLMLWGAEQLLSALHAGATLVAIDHLAHEIPVNLRPGAATNPGEPDYSTVYGLATLSDEMYALSGELPSSRYYHAWGVWVACMEALRAALGVGWWDPEEDGAAWAARTYAGGAWTATDIYARWDSSGDEGEWDTSADEVRHKRCEFWTWWCQTLIPQTWHEL